MPLEDRNGEPSRLMVGLAGLEVSQDPGIMLCTLPLGAGVGLAIYDPKARVGGLLHSLLPASSLDPQRAANHPGMFLDTGLEALLARAQRLNATRPNIRVFVAGAARIMDENPLFDIGKSNGDVLGELLAQQGVELYARQVGGRTDCSMELTLATGEVRLRFSGQAGTQALCKP